MVSVALRRVVEEVEMALRNPALKPEEAELLFARVDAFKDPLVSKVIRQTYGETRKMGDLANEVRNKSPRNSRNPAKVRSWLKQE